MATYKDDEEIVDGEGSPSTLDQTGPSAGEVDYQATQNKMGGGGGYTAPAVPSPSTYDPTTAEDGPYNQGAAAAPGQPRKLMSMLDLVRQQEPVEDTGVQQRAQKAALLSGIGSAFGSFAGALGGSMGAYVPRIAQNDNIEKLYGIADKEKDKYDILHRQWQQNMGNAAYSDQSAAIQQDNYTAKMAHEQRQEAERIRESDRTYGLGVANHNQKASYENSSLEERTRNNAFDRRIKGANLDVAIHNSNKPTSAEYKDANALPWANPETGKPEPYNAANRLKILTAAQELSQTDKTFSKMAKPLTGVNRTDGRDNELATMYLQYMHDTKKAEDQAAGASGIMTQGMNAPSYNGVATGNGTSTIPQGNKPAPASDAQSQWNNAPSGTQFNINGKIVTKK